MKLTLELHAVERILLHPVTCGYSLLFQRGWGCRLFFGVLRGRRRVMKQNWSCFKNKAGSRVLRKYREPNLNSIYPESFLWSQTFRNFLQARHCGHNSCEPKLELSDNPLLPIFRLFTKIVIHVLDNFLGKLLIHQKQEKHYKVF